MPKLLKNNGEILAVAEDVDAIDEIIVVPRIRFVPTGLFCQHGRTAKWWWFQPDRTGGGTIICDCPDNHEVIGYINVDLETKDWDNGGNP
jgi:hypothetical protein